MALHGFSRMVVDEPLESILVQPLKANILFFFLTEFSFLLLSRRIQGLGMTVTKYGSRQSVDLSTSSRDKQRNNRK